MMTPTREQDPVARIHDQIIEFSRSTRLHARDMYGGLSFVAYAVITFVAAADCPHASDLASDYGMDKSTVSRQIAELMSEGLLDRTRDPDHPRRQKLTLTAEGRRMLRKIRAGQRQRLEESLSDWPAADIETFSELLGRFVART